MRLGLWQLRAKAAQRLVQPGARRGEAQLGQGAELAADVRRAGLGETRVAGGEVGSQPGGGGAAVPAGKGPEEERGGGRG